MPSSLLHSVSTNPLTKHLSGHKQHDAHEFLVAFLNAIIEVEEKEKGNRAQSEVEKLFQGKMQSKLTCGYCSHSSSVSETFINISLPMSTMSGMNMYTSESKSNTPQGTPSSTPSPSPTPEVMLAGGGGAAKERPSNVTLESLLQKFTSLESLTDSTCDNLVCSKCMKRGGFKKQLSFESLPEILVIQLKRFDGVRRKKITVHVDFPVDGLMMGVGGEGGEVAEYVLTGVVEHIGSSMDQGHYSNFIREEGGGGNFIGAETQSSPQLVCRR